MRQFIRKHIVSMFLWIFISLASQLVPALLSGEWLDWHFYLWASMLTGGLIAATLASIHYYRLKKLGIENLSEKDTHYKQQQQIHTLYSREEVIKRTEIFLRKKLHQASDNLFEARTWGVFGWNKTIIEFSYANNNCLRVYIVSQPVFKATFLDYARNLEIVKGLKEVLENPYPHS